MIYLNPGTYASIAAIRPDSTIDAEIARFDVNASSAYSSNVVGVIGTATRTPGASGEDVAVGYDLRCKEDELVSHNLVGKCCFEYIQSSFKLDFKKLILLISQNIFLLFLISQNIFFEAVS